MKELILIGINILLVFSANSQTMVSGRVFSSPDRHPLEIATISVSEESSGEFVTGTITGEDGRFSIFINESGEYLVTISFVGFTSCSLKIFTGGLNKNLDLGEIILKSVMDGNRVSGENELLPQIPYKLEKKDYPMVYFVSTTTGSLPDVLKTLPGITITSENKIILKGSDKVAILLDGQPSAVTGFKNQKGLENISGSQIESIKIINTPSAIYETAGMAGVVNIRFKKVSVKEINGDFGINSGIGILEKRKPDLPSEMGSYSKNPKLTPSLNLNYKKDKLNISWKSSWTHQKSLPNNEFSTRKFENGGITETQVAENRSQDLFNLKIGLDWTPTLNQTLSLFGMVDYEGLIDTSQVWYFRNRDFSSPARKWAFRESTGSGYTNLILKHTLGFRQPGRELHNRLFFSKGWENVTNKLHQNGPAPYPVIGSDKTHLLSPEYIWSFSTDYIQPLAFGRLEAGLEGRLRHMPVSYTEMKNIQNTALTYDFGNWFHWDENIVGTYFNLVTEFDNLDINASLRADYTTVKYELTPFRFFKEDKYNYLALLPDFLLTIKPSKTNLMDLFISRRIVRPSDDVLRIFPEYDDPELLKIGNPSLKPQYTNTIGLAYRHIWKKGYFRISLFHKLIEASLSGVYIPDTLQSNLIINAFDNTGKSTNTGIELSFDQKVGKFWEINASFNVFRNIISSHTAKIMFPIPQYYMLPKRYDTPMYAKMTNQFNLPGNFTFQINVLGLSDRNFGQIRELARGSLDVGMKKTFAKNKLELNLFAADILNTMGIRQYIQLDGFMMEYMNFYETQVISLGLKYKF